MAAAPPALAAASAAASAGSAQTLASAAPAVTGASAALAANTPVARAASAALSPATAATTTDLKAEFDSLLEDERQAWQQLAGLWKLELGEDAEPCRLAQRQQVQCFRSQTTLALIRQLDRPGIVSLHDGQGRTVHALLTGLQGANATLQSGGSTLEVPLAALATVWRGEFSTLWRAPQGWRNDVLDGSSAAVAQWLSTQLARAQGQPMPGPNDATGSALRSRVAAFQLAQGLQPDGLVGPMTLMQLNRASGVDEPRLQVQR